MLCALSYPSLARFFRRQSVYVAISVVVVAIFWANGQKVNLANALVSTLCIGNLLAPALNRLQFLYWRRPFPFNWLIFLSVLLVLMVPVYIITSAVVWLIAPPVPQSFSELILTGWKFALLITFVFGIVSFLFHSTKDRLMLRNTELQQSMERGAARIEMQELELRRAREIQQSLLPREIPQLPGFEVAGAWLPALSVSGDYYDVLRLDGHRLGICIADVAGKGVSAALLMANVQAAVRAYANDTESPARLCSKVNSLLHENIAIGKFVTFLLWNPGYRNAYLSVLQRRASIPNPSLCRLRPDAGTRRRRARRFPRLDIGTRVLSSPQANACSSSPTASPKRQMQTVRIRRSKHRRICPRQRRALGKGVE